jgi:16S rRNA (cytosine967-C5)-methyltransferase
MVEESLAEYGIKTEKTALPGALEVTGNARRLRQAPAYAEGLVEIQDLSVQMACAAIDWPQSGRILDYCAGGGGKTLAIAAESGAALFAHDANPARMADLPARAARAGARFTALATSDLPRHAPYDLVLCDVPCSGSGTWRRDPEAKWRLTPERLAELTRLQRDIVSHAQGLVAQGGRLVYMTCSLLDAENEAVMRDACAPGWTLLQQRRFAPPDASDGFFLAELRREAP